MIKVAVIGARGRMGSAVVAAAQAASDMEVVAQLDQGDPITEATLAGAEVAVDFTIPSVTRANAAAVLAAGCNVVVGTTGWDEAARAELAAQISGDLCAMVVPNFSLSAVLAMQFAAQAASYFESVEVIEMHHPDKLDAPSGTAYATASAIAQARRSADCPPIPDATSEDPLGARGALVEGVPVHAVRLRGLVAHEEVLLGNPGEQLVIRSDCFDRISFMPGVLLAVRQAAERRGFIHGLQL